MRNILEREPGYSTPRVHLPNDYSATTFHTLCGLCDVPATIEDTDEPVDCTTCMAVLAHVLQLAAERGVIRNYPRSGTRERARKPTD